MSPRNYQQPFCGGITILSDALTPHTRLKADSRLCHVGSSLRVDRCDGQFGDASFEAF